MENQNIMNEAILEEAVETEVINSSKGITEKVVSGAVLIGGAFLAYKGVKVIVNKVVKPAAKKVKTFIEAKKSKAKTDGTEICESDFVEVE